MRRALFFALCALVAACSASSSNASNGDAAPFVCDLYDAPSGACVASDPTCTVWTPDHCYATCSCVDGAWRCDDATCIVPDAGDASKGDGSDGDASDGSGG